jgi:predicted naringenin-chalcone synthase
VVGEQLGLDEAALAVSRGTLAEHGNCSAPTVLMILEALRRGRRADQPDPLAGPAPTMLMAFGPGLTLYSVLLSLPRS